MSDRRRREVLSEPAKAHQCEECAANCCHVCAGSDHRERRQSDPACESSSPTSTTSSRSVGGRSRQRCVKFEMSRQGAPTRMTTRLFSTSASQRACSRGATRGRRESGVRGDDARVCHEQGREDSTGSADNQKCGNGREVPTEHEALGQENAATAARVRSRRRATSNSREVFAMRLILKNKIQCEW